MLGFLSAAHGALGTLRTTRRRLPSPRLQRAGQRWIEREIARVVGERPADVTVVIGVRDRPAHRLANALDGLRAQTHPSELVRPVVVDWGSAPDYADATRAVCAEAGAEYVRVEGVTVWSRSRCLNIGIRRATTAFVLTADADVVLSRTYLEDAVALLAQSPLCVPCSAMLDLPEASATAAERRELDLGEWRGRCVARHGWELHPSIAMTYTAVHHAIRGYDEFYEVWGAEDDDLMRRLAYLGLTPAVVADRSFYVHQWHPAEERGRDGANEARVEANRAHLERTHSIRRNGPRWGLPAGRPAA